jgi:penicillin-binding protein 1A
VALDYDDKNVQIGFADGTTGLIPYDGYKWANRQLPGAVWGPRPTTPQEVVKPGDVFYVEPLPAPAKANEFGLRQVPEVNGAIVVMDPHTGWLKALVGGRDYGRSQLNHALAKRQPGSSFKPFVYAAAGQWLHPGQQGAGRAVRTDRARMPIWRPENFEKGDYLGDTTKAGPELPRI